MRPSQPGTSRWAFFPVVAAPAVMIAVKSMTPLHRQHYAGHSSGQPEAIALVGRTISLHIAGMLPALPR